jgi:hypothetical protein
MTNPTPCPKCSRPIPDADKFCGGCGTEMPEAPAEMLHVPQEVHERGWQWRPVGDGAFAPPFGTIRACRVCGCLVAGGPTMCMRCTKADGLLAAPPAQPPAGDAGETLVMWLAEKRGTSIFGILSPAQVAEEGDRRIADQAAARRADREEIGRLTRERDAIRKLFEERPSVPAHEHPIVVWMHNLRAILDSKGTP